MTTYAYFPVPEEHVPPDTLAAAEQMLALVTEDLSITQPVNLAWLRKELQPTGGGLEGSREPVLPARGRFEVQVLRDLRPSSAARSVAEELYSRYGSREVPPDNYFGLLGAHEARAWRYAELAVENLYPGEGGS
jgi:hypothetical protein